MTTLGPETLKAIDELKAAREEGERKRATEVYQATMLAPTLGICEALLRGENVPLESLDPEWVRRFAFKR